MASMAFICFLIFCCSLLVANAQHFTQVITSTDNRQVTVQLDYFPFRSSNFGVLIEQDNGTFTSHTAHAPRTYLGTVKGYSGAMASALRKPNGSLLCRISFEDGSEWSSTDGAASVSERSWKPQWPTSVVPATTSNSILYVAEVGVDVSHAAYVARNSDIQDTIDIVEFSILAANVPFLRDASILHKVGKLVIRKRISRDPYPSTSTSVLLSKVRQEWNGPLSKVVGKTQHLALVSRPGAGGGLAYVGTVATSWAYSSNGAAANGDFSVLWRHEAGHNWGSGHYEGGGNPEGSTIMSNNALSRFSSSELLKILLYKAKVPRLSNTTLVISRPPRANMDAVTLPGSHSLPLDVVANDLDANFGSLKIISVVNPSLASSITKISQGGSSRDKINYTSSVAASVSGDSFSYTIQNAQGKTSTGYVVLTPEALVGWWKIDETSGTSLKDSSRNRSDGLITGPAIWNQGLVFSGATTVALGTKPSLSGQTSFSLSLWLKTTSNTPSSNNVLIQQRSPPTNTTGGYNGQYQLYLQDGGRPALLVYGDDAYQFEFSTTTSVNDEQWHHIIALRDGSEGRIFIDGRLSASASSSAKNLDGSIPVFLGSDARDNAGFFTGTLSGVRIYNRALNVDEISYLSTRPEALVGWWKLDESNGSSARDSSGNGATGTITGSTSWDQSGGLVFQGAGKVAFGTTPSLSGKTSFSIHAWVNVPTSSKSKGVIIQQRGPTGFNGQYQLYLREGTKPALLVFGDGGFQFDFSTSTGINDGQWHHVIALREGDEGRIYIDGRLSASASGKVKTLNGNIPVFIGWDSRNNAAFLTATVRDVRVYNRAVVVTLQQILQLLSAA